MSFLKRWLVAGVAAAGLLAACAPAGEKKPGAPEPKRETQNEGRAPGGAVAPAVVGVIVSQSGSPFLERYGALVLEGIRLAVERHNAAGGRPVELAVLDDRGEPARAAALVGELERRGAVAVLGPLRPDGVSAAARARKDSLLVLLSPTAPDLPRGGQVYSLNSADVRGAEMLGTHAATTGLKRVALLYAGVADFQQQVRAFRGALMKEGGAVVAEVAYTPGTTTFAKELQSIAKAKPDAIFIPASERDVRLIAPQIAYYGVGGRVRILGGEAWVGDEVLQGVEPRYLEGVVAPTPLYRPSPAFGWSDFVSLYEKNYRKSLENPLPALGYDAATLVLRSLGRGKETPAEVARRFEAQGELRGATGRISVQKGEVSRRPLLVRIEKGELVPVAGGSER
jgi:ABC-type branched-subunit amino acid transport system substrate-binding protein